VQRASGRQVIRGASRQPVSPAQVQSAPPTALALRRG
jgi:hypothetical protein